MRNIFKSKKPQVPQQKYIGQYQDLEIWQLDFENTPLRPVIETTPYEVPKEQRKSLEIFDAMNSAQEDKSYGMVFIGNPDDVWKPMPIESSPSGKFECYSKLGPSHYDSMFWPWVCDLDNWVHNDDNAIGLAEDLRKIGQPHDNTTAYWVLKQLTNKQLEIIGDCEGFNEDMAVALALVKKERVPRHGDAWSAAPDSKRMIALKNYRNNSLYVQYSYKDGISGPGRLEIIAPPHMKIFLWNWKDFNRATVSQKEAVIKRLINEVPEALMEMLPELKKATISKTAMSL